MSSADIKALVDVSAKGAEQFVDLYYKLYDDQRHLLGKFYRDNSAIVWNGNAYSGVTPFSEFYQKLPSTVHEIQAFDCHPLPFTGPTEGPFSILVNVTGSVKYGKETVPRLFSQNFVLTPDPTKLGNFYVGSDCLRFV
ncbi:hypothetical protein K7432_007290 [Basidiobolus ranarum]|uniref:NTF2-related export protein n=1 Tax=Basidiobolus ranarum TaxID=34480 RepID=A0ABR2WTJ7_9FUNG